MVANTTLDAIVKYAGQFDKKMIMQVLNGLDIAKDVNVHNNVSLHGKLLPKLTVTKGIRPLSTSVETRAGSQRSLGARKLYVYEGMKIIDFIPEEVRESYLSDMVKPGAIEMPLAQYFWEAEMAKIASEINDSIYMADYNGDAAAFDSGAAYAVGDYMYFGDYADYYKCTTITTAGQSPLTHPAKWTEVNASVISTGFGTIIANEITASNLTAVVTGALSNSNALDKVELMFNDMTEARRKKGGIFYMAPDKFRNYVKHEQTVFTSQNTPESGDGEKFVYGSEKKWRIMPATWLAGSGRVIATQKENLAFGTNVLTDQTKVAKTIETLHGNRSVVKWLQGCEIADLEAITVNDQA